MIKATLNQQSVIVICMALDFLADDLERTITLNNDSDKDSNGGDL